MSCANSLGESIRRCLGCGFGGNRTPRAGFDSRCPYSTAEGLDIRYAYDALNRMFRTTGASDYTAIGFNQDTNYTYDAVGNLDSVTYPSEVKHKYTYNALTG
jgi:hypothetical protein